MQTIKEAAYRFGGLYDSYIRLPRATFLVASIVILTIIAVTLGLIYALVLQVELPPSAPNYALSQIGASRFFFVLLVAVVVAPLAETFVFQYVPYRLFNALGVNSLFLCAVAAALVFLLSHSGNRLKLIQIGILGLVYYFLYAERKRAGATNPYLDVALLHAARNGLAGVVLVFL